VWNKAKINQLQKREVEESLAILLAAVEWDLARHQGESMTIATLSEHYGFSPKKAEDLVQCELVDWEIIEELAEQLLDEETLAAVRTDWRWDAAKEKMRQSFKRLCRTALMRSDITAADAGRALDIRPPEERKENYDAPDRKQHYRPDALVRSVMFDNRATPLVPVDPLMRILAQESDMQFSDLAEQWLGSSLKFLVAR